MANKKQTTTEGSGEQMTTGGSGNLGSTKPSNTAGGGNTPNRSNIGQTTSTHPVSSESSFGQSDPGRSDMGRSSSAQSGPGRAGTGMATTTNTGGGAGAGTAAARSLYEQAKETAGQAYEIAAEKATTKLEEQKTTLSGGLSTIAESVRKVGENLRGPDVQEGLSKYTAEYSGKAAEKISGVADYFEQKSVREMYSDLENYARRNPVAFIGGAFALGLLTARFLKSDNQRRINAQGATFATESASGSYPATSGDDTSVR